MKQRDIRTLYDYNYWANARVLRAAAQLTPEQFTAPAHLSHGSVRGTLVHALSAEWVWRVRCEEGISPPAMLQEQDVPTFDALAERWNAEEQAMRRFLHTLHDQQLEATYRYRTTRGVESSSILWHVLLHVVNHGTQFRSEAAVALSSYGHSPGDLDMIMFFREQQYDVHGLSTRK